MHLLFLDALCFSALLAGQSVSYCPQAEQFCKRHQRPDGSYVDYRGHVVAAKPKLIERTRLRTTSVMTLAILGDGSTMRSGPYKNQVKNAVKWLIREIDDKGRIALRSDPGWFVDHALGTFMLAEAARLSKYRTLDRRVAACAGFLRRYLGTEGVTVTPEILFWARAAVTAMRDCNGAATEKIPQPFALSHAEGKRLHRALGPHEKRLEGAEPKTELEHALRLLRSVRFRKDKIDAACEKLLVAATKRLPDVAGMHPKAVALYSIAMYQAGSPWHKTWQKAMTTALVRTQLEGKVTRGSWQVPVGQEKAIGPVETTAWNILSLECYYRYIRSSLIE